MSDCCKNNHCLPDTTNYCNSINGTYEIPNFCTTAGPAGDSKRQTYCEKLGNAGEWTISNDEGKTCNYYDCDGSVSVWCGSGTCSGACCKIIGSGAKCKRIGFTGDPNACCLKDYNCTKSDNSCFSDETKTATCSDGSNGTPNYRRITSTDCRATLRNYCTGTMKGDNYNSVEWLNRFYGNDSCVDAIKKNVYFIPNTSAECGKSSSFSGDGFFWSQSIMTDIFKHYTDNGYVIGSFPGNKGYNIFQNVLYDICNEIPGLCQDSLQHICRNYNSSQLSNNPQLNIWCGCHMNKTQYEPYSTKYNIPLQCSPNCNRSGVIQASGSDGKANVCDQNICIIDNINLNLMKSSGQGNINFEQVCGYCPNGECSCLISDVDIKAVNTLFNQSNININQTCLSTTCNLINKNQNFGPTQIPVNCDNFSNPLEKYQEAVSKQVKKANTNYIFWLILILSFVVFFILIFWFIRYKRFKK